MASKQPLRAALIGLSANAKTSWAAGAHLPGLLTEAGRSRFTIAALLNSSVEAAQAAIKTFNLPPSTKAYGSPEDLAKDPDIDLVICNTRVDKHYQTIMPSIKAGQDVYVEWPIGANLKQAHEVLDAARQSGSRVAVGLQRPWLPQVVKLRELIQEGKLGKILSSNVQSYGGTNDRQSLPAGLKYFTDRKVGGNPITISVAHLLDFVLSVTGDLAFETVESRTQLQRPDRLVKNPETGEILETVRSDVPDLLSFHGSLTNSPYTTPSATLSFFFRLGQPFPGTPSLTWTINFEHGEIRLVSPDGLALEFSTPDRPVTIQIHHYDSNKVVDVPWEWSEKQKEIPMRARGVQTCLYAIADGKKAGDGWMGIEKAVERAELIDSFLTKFAKSQ